MDKPRPRLVSSQGSTLQPDIPVTVIASIIKVEIVVPWYLRAFSDFIPDHFQITIQDFSEEYKSPLDIPMYTEQCNSYLELRAALTRERKRAYPGKLRVIDFTDELGVLELEFNT